MVLDTPTTIRGLCQVCFTSNVELKIDKDGDAKCSKCKGKKSGADKIRQDSERKRDMKTYGYSGIKADGTHSGG